LTLFISKEGNVNGLYMSVLLDDSIRKRVCRLYFNSAKKYLGLIDDQKNEERVEIGSIDDIYEYAEQLKTAAQRYDAPAVPESEAQ